MKQALALCIAGAFLVAAILSSGCGPDSRFQKIFTNDEITAYLDTSSVRLVENETIAECWVRLEVTGSTKQNMINILNTYYWDVKAPQGFSYYMTKEQYRLRDKQVKALEVVFYDTKDTEMLRRTVTSSWDIILPNSLSESTLNALLRQLKSDGVSEIPSTTSPPVRSSSNNTPPSTNTSVAGQLQASDMILVGMRCNKNTFMDAERALGTSWAVTKLQGNGPNGPEDTGLVLHKGYGLTITEDSNNNRNIVQIMLTDQHHTTAKGITVGDTAEKIVAAYGEPSRKSSKKDGTVWYCYENKEFGDRLTFIVSQNTISSIVNSVLPYGP